MESGARFLTATDLSTVTSTKQEAYGTVGATGDGRRFRYVQYGGTVTGGNLVIAPSLVANHQNVAVQTAAPIGATTVFVTLGATAATQDQYAEGSLIVGVAGSGVPQIRKIKGNTAGGSGAVIQVFLDGREPLITGLTTANVVSLSPSLFNGAVASSTAGLPIGVAVASTTANTWGWVQTYGPCQAVNDAGATLTALTKIKQSTTVAGAVVASAAATDVQVGTVVQSTAVSTAGLIVINLD
jgi:hypothetical protein